LGSGKSFSVNKAFTFLNGEFSAWIEFSLSSGHASDHEDGEKAGDEERAMRFMP